MGKEVPKFFKVFYFIFFLKLPMKKLCLNVVLIFLMISGAVEAGIENRPLNTDDAFTLDKNTGTAAFGVTYVNEDNGDDQIDFPLNIGYGFTETFEVTANIPYTYFNPEQGPDLGGISDISLRPEWNFFQETQELPALSFATVVKFDNGSERRGLGSGEVDVSLSLQASKTFSSLTGHFNIGYTFVREPSGTNLDNVVFYNFGLQNSLNDVFSLVGEIVGQTNSEPAGDDDLWEGLVGFIYQPIKNYAIDAGIGFGLTDSSPDVRTTIGLTYSFQ